MKKTLIAALLVAVAGSLFVAGSSFRVHAQAPITPQALGPWSTHGPYGGTVFNVSVDAVDPATAYVAAAQVGVFGTRNGGLNWSLLLYDAEWMCASDAQLVAHHTQAGRVYFVGSHDLWRSDDYGQNWSRLLRDDSTSIGGRSLVIDRTNPLRMFVSAEDGKVFRSLDAGDAWTTLSTGLPTNLPLTEIAMDPVVTTTLYAASREGDGVWISTNSGDSWQHTPSQPAVEDAWSLEVSPHDRWVWQGGWFGPLSYSHNQGSTWYTTTVESAKPDRNYVTIRFHPAQTATVFVGDIDNIWRSPDRGQTWGVMAQNTGWGLAVHPGQPNHMYAVATGVKTTSDGGTHWQARNEGVTAVAPRVIAISPADTNRVLVGASYTHGFFSLDGGQHWYDSTTDLYHAIAFDPVAPDTVYASSTDWVNRSTDGDVNWSQLAQLNHPPDMDMVYVRALAVHPVTDTLLYAGVGFHRNDTPVLQTGGLYRSQDSGQTWDRVQISLPISRVSTLVVAPTAPYTMYLATGRIEHHLEQGNGIFRSTDSGDTWTRINIGLPDLNMRTLAINPHNHSELLAAPWENSDDYFGGLGVYRSVNGGDSWAAANSGLETLTVADNEYDPAAPGVVYAATWGGLFYSVDGGQTWHRWSGDIGQVPIYSVAAAAINDSESVVYVGTVGGSAGAGGSALSATDVDDVVQAGVYRNVMVWSRTYLPTIRRQ